MGRITCRIGSFALLLLCLGAADVGARDLFTTKISTISASSRDETNSLLKVPDLFDIDNLDKLLPGYNPVTDLVFGTIDLRGLQTALEWNPVATTLTIRLLGEKVTFTASSLDDALDELEDWFKGGSDGVGSLEVTDLLQGLVAYSPVDPVAGNPNSLQSRMFQSDFELGTQGPFTSGSERLKTAPDQFGVGLDYGYAKAEGFNVQAVDLPLGYRWNFRNPRWSMLFSLPLTATFTQGQWSALASAAVGIQYRPFEWWSLTPLVRVGGVGSIDVGALALLYSVTLTNHMRFEWRGIEFAMGNMGGFTKSIDGITIGGYELSYDLTNPILTNGGTISGNFPGELFDRTLRWRLFGWNTQVFGDEVYAESQSEVGASIALQGTAGGERYDFVSLGLGYVFGNEDYDGVSARVRFRF
jgi:hypothetical protein